MAYRISLSRHCSHIWSYEFIQSDKVGFGLELDIFEGPKDAPHHFPDILAAKEHKQKHTPRSLRRCRFFSRAQS